MKKQNIIQILSYILLLAGAAMQAFNEHCFAPYIFAVGALGVIAMAVVDVWRNRTKDFRQNRLLRINLIASLVLALGAYLMFTGSNSWVVMVLLYAVLSVFLSFRIK